MVILSFVLSVTVISLLRFFAGKTEGAECTGLLAVGGKWKSRTRAETNANANANANANLRRLITYNSSQHVFVLESNFKGRTNTNFS